MTSNILSSELSTIIQESKRKNNELRNAAEKALQDLKALPSTSEAQLAGDLQRRPHFVIPFLTACKTGNAKLVLPAVTCLQRLIVSGGLPKDRLKETLDCFQESNKISFDIQLKILQSLPSLLQSYVDLLEGEVLSTLLQLLITLQQVKTAAISSTASATLQQVVSFVFDKVEVEDSKGNEVAVSASLALDSGQVYVRPSAHDAYRVLEDLCLLTEGQRTRFIQNAALPQSFGLELIEAVLTNHGEILNAHAEQAHLLRNLVMPLVTRLLSEKLNFGITVRTFRILCLLLREHLKTVEAECEVPLSLLNHMLDSESATPWKRALCMETFRVIYSGSNIAVEIYAMFDEQEGKRNIIQENLASFVRLSTEKPALIGIGQQSSFPSGKLGGSSHEQAGVLEAGSVAGIIPGEVGVSEVNAPGISAQWSSMRVPCLDILDKTEPPPIPETYMYSLVLTCTNNLSESLAKVVLPLTSFEKLDNGHSRPRRPTIIRSETQGIEEISTTNGVPQNDEKANNTPIKRSTRAIPTNPLSLEDHPSYSTICTISKLVNECWPAMLATASTFLYAALDADYYRSLIRSIQKFTQVAGLMRLETPRDALLTTLAKAAVPPNILKNELLASPTSGTTSPRVSSNHSFENISSQAASESSTNRTRRESIDASGPTLSQRNLMCLRALINLGIALGSILEQAWSIILENLQKADIILSQTGLAASAREYRQGTQAGERQGNDATGQTTLSSEIAAVEAAISRLLQSTSEYPNTAFIPVIEALCNLISPGAKAHSGTSSTQLRPQTPRRSTSISTVSLPRNKHFAVAKLGEISRINLDRLAFDGVEGGWKLITGQMSLIATSFEEDNTTRLMAADVLASIAVGVATATINEETDIRGEVQHRSLSILDVEIRALSNKSQVQQLGESGINTDVHRSALEAMRAILEQCGDRLVSGSGNWRLIFSIFQSVFRKGHLAVSEAEMKSNDSRDSVQEDFQTSLPPDKIVRSAFGSIQLICSDFLSGMPRSRMITFTTILSQCCRETTDLNISLTTIALFWNVLDFLQRQLDEAKTLHAKQFDFNVVDEGKISEKAVEGSVLAMWMILQRQLASITEDSRADVRNGAIHTIFRILDSCENLPSPIWIASLRGVVLKTMEINIRENDKHRYSTDSGLISTADLILQSFGNLFATHLDTTVKLPKSEFESAWDSMLDRFSSYLDLGSYEVSASIFNCLSHILGSFEDTEMIDFHSIIKVASLWAKNLPETSRPTENASSNEKALVAYMACLREILRLIGADIESAQIKNIVGVIQRCIAVSRPTPYSSDVDSTTKLQDQILASIQLLRTEKEEVAVITIPCVAHFATQPYRQQLDSSNLSFIAFAKKAMDLLQSLVVSNIKSTIVYESGALATALKALADSISRKYKWRRLGKENDLWRKATSVAIEIIKAALKDVGNLQITTERMDHFWRGVVETAAGIADADLTQVPSNDVLVKDETFDLASLESLTTALWWPSRSGEPNINRLLAQQSETATQESLWLDYITAIFRNSLLHDADLPPRDAPLAGLYTPRHGRTFDPSFNPRVRMCYACTDELFALVDTRHTSESAPHRPRRLAQLALPYAILRCALPLRRYIADQPLRGKMPTPTSQRLEVLYVLQKARELECAVDVEGDAAAEQGVLPLNPRRRHMAWLVPLVNQAMGPARRDEEISRALRLTMDEALKL